MEHEARYLVIAPCALHDPRQSVPENEKVILLAGLPEIVPFPVKLPVQPKPSSSMRVKLIVDPVMFPLIVPALGPKSSSEVHVPDRLVPD